MKHELHRQNMLVC